jgi:molecular chaperone DnaK
MTRTTIDFGIDLGTTNSSIAIFEDGEAEVLKNNDNFEYTPSAVWFDKHDSLVVGRVAKEHLEYDSDNAASEFKRLMGTAERKTFSRSGKSMTPEELSAEVLKTLKGDARQRGYEDITAAVITVPADFDLPQCEATSRAAKLAGLTQSPLLTEPVAAALAYGFQSQSDKVFWLVYDFGGGTFDAAVIQIRDGAIEVVNHGGDNQLGGKNIDWKIVENILAPALTNVCPLDNFKRGRKEWRSAFAKLKWHAEQAKIALSRRETFNIDITFSTDDNFPEPFQFDYLLKQSDVAAAAEPFIIKSINICKKTLADKRLESSNIEKVILVGGPTQAPYLRERLSDRIAGLGIPLEYRVDPMTVVAQGAALFAGTQRIIDIDPPDPFKGRFKVTFPDWKFTGIDEEHVVAGKVEAPVGQSLDGFTIEFINKKIEPAWRSGKLPLRKGSFMTTLWAEKKGANIYQVELLDNTGHQQKVLTDPGSLTYTIGIINTDPPLTHTLGVALVNNEFEVFIKKGTPLPAKRVDVLLHTTVNVHKEQKGDLIRILVMEGESPRADRNRRVAVLEIPSNKIKRDVPAGSEIEITIDIDPSRLLKTSAFIPILDDIFEDVIPYNPDENKFDPKVFGEELKKEKERLANMQEQTRATGDEKALLAAQRIEQEQMVQQVDAAFAAASDDADDARTCKNLLLDLRKAIDEIEDALEWPALVLKAEKLISEGQEIGQKHGNPEERRTLQSEETQLRRAMQSHDTELLDHQIGSYRTTVLRILERAGILQVWDFQYLCDRKAEMRDQVRAQELISEGYRAMDANDSVRLRAIDRQLDELLPTLPQGTEPDDFTNLGH